MGDKNDYILGKVKGVERFQPPMVGVSPFVTGSDGEFKLCTVGCGDCVLRHEGVSRDADMPLESRCLGSKCCCSRTSDRLCKKAGCLSATRE